jgi:hypothetical protein
MNVTVLEADGVGDGSGGAGAADEETAGSADGAADDWVLVFAPWPPPATRTTIMMMNPATIKPPLRSQWRFFGGCGGGASGVLVKFTTARYTGLSCLAAALQADDERRQPVNEADNAAGNTTRDHTRRIEAGDGQERPQCEQDTADRRELGTGVGFRPHHPGDHDEAQGHEDGGGHACIVPEWWRGGKPAVARKDHGRGLTGV